MKSKKNQSKNDSDDYHQRDCFALSEKLDVKRSEKNVETCTFFKNL